MLQSEGAQQEEVEARRYLNVRDPDQSKPAMEGRGKDEDATYEQLQGCHLITRDHLQTILVCKD